MGTTAAMPSRPGLCCIPRHCTGMLLPSCCVRRVRDWALQSREGLAGHDRGWEAAGQSLGDRGIDFAVRRQRNRWVRSRCPATRALSSDGAQVTWGPNDPYLAWGRRGWDRSSARCTASTQHPTSHPTSSSTTLYCQHQHQHRHQTLHSTTHHPSSASQIFLASDHSRLTPCALLHAQRTPLELRVHSLLIRRSTGDTDRE